METKKGSAQQGRTRIFLQMIGVSNVAVWGLSTAERTRRMVAKKGDIVSDPSAADAILIVNAGFVFDPQWLDRMMEHPGMVLTTGDAPVIAHVAPGKSVDPIATELAGGSVPASLQRFRAEDHPLFYNVKLRKREEPFLLDLTPENARLAEHLSYAASYKGVTDLLTKYLWRGFAFHLTRLAAAIRLSPNMITSIGAIFCVVATFCFWYGHYWTGLLTGLVFMILDTVDGKLARCTITSSTWGNIFDHGMDIVHPPFWWWAWGVGLGAWHLALPIDTFALVMIVIVGGYVLQRLIEGAFIKYLGLEIHVWRRFDSLFRLVTARRNPNMVILAVALAVGRPDWGLIAVAWWTLFCLLVHLVRLVQAWAARREHKPLISWMESGL
jgi:phosphatidylglycerophosphate synthase